MGMWVRNEGVTFYRDNGKTYSGPDKKVEYSDGKPIYHEPVKAETPPIEEQVLVVGMSREELEAMDYSDILKSLNLRPAKGMTKEVLIKEILGAQE